MKRPNILIFMTDHQRGDTVLPEHPAVTPNVDKLAQEGITFANTFCPSPHCSPSRAAFFSGLYPSRSGIWNHVNNQQALSTRLNEDVILWSEDLENLGYKNYFSGKWHVSGEESPEDRGFNELSVISKPGMQSHKSAWDTYRKIAQKPYKEEREEGEMLRPGYPLRRLYGRREGKTSDERFTDEAVEIMPELAELNTPWSLFVGVTGPHDPYLVPQKYLDLYNLDDISLPESYYDDMNDKPVIYKRMRKQTFDQLTEKEAREAVRHFWAYCSYLDDIFGRLIDGLKKTGQYENTLILYCADHGDYCGEHGLFCKGIPAFKGAYHIPGIMNWPEGIKNPGQRIEELVSLADFAPTFIDAAGGKPDRDLSGKSLLPFIQGKKPKNWRESIHTQCNGVELYYTQRSVLTRDFKYVFNGFDRDELYDLRSDPHEMNNLIDNEEYREILRALVQKMWKFAYQEKDGAINDYITVGLAPFGPAEAFKDERTLDDI